MRAGGAPDLDQPGARELLGRTLGRIHAIGALRPFAVRPAMRADRLGARARQVVLSSGQLPEHMRERYARVSVELLALIDAAGLANGRTFDCTGIATWATSCGRRKVRCLSIWMTV